MAHNLSSKARVGGGLRKRVAVVVDAFDAKYQANIITHLKAAAEQRRIRLVVFPGGIIGSRHRGAPCTNTLYDLIDAASVDGVILLSSTISSRIGLTGLADFCKRFRGLPLCSIGDRLPDVSSVTINNESGVRAMVRHLIVDHGYRRFAFIRGTPGNIEADARFEAFCSELGQHGLECDPALTPAGDFLLDSGRVAMKQLRSPHRQFDAVFACNDYMALGALEAMGQPQSCSDRRIAVVGFDNIEEANVSTPPLSTIEQPFAQMAEAALRSILAQVQGEEAPGVQSMDTWLVLRRSCGCSNPAKKEPCALLQQPTVSGGSLEVKFLRRRDCVIAELSRAARGQFHGLKNWENSLLNALVDDLRGIPGNTFCTAVHRLLQGLASREYALWRLQDIVGVLRQQTLLILGDAMLEREHAEDLFQTARALCFEAVVRVQAHARLWAERTMRSMNDLGTALSECTDHDELRRCLDTELPKVGVSHLTIAVYEGDEARRRAFALYCFDREPGAFFSRTESYPANELLPEPIWQRLGEQSWVSLPRFFGQQSFGFAIAILDHSEGAVYESLRLHVSSALRHVISNALGSSGLMRSATARPANAGSAS